MLNCSCGSEFGDDYGTWVYYPPCDFSKLKTKRRKRCKSCDKLINIEDDVLEFHRARTPYTEIEREISGDEISCASYYHCRSCGEIYLNLSDIGYCIDITKNMNDYLEGYHEITGFIK